MNLTLKLAAVLVSGWLLHQTKPMIDRAIDAEGTQYLSKYALGCLALEPATILIYDDLKELQGVQRVFIAFNLALGALGLGVVAAYVIEAWRSNR